jgi:hypothetical protein
MDQIINLRTILRYLWVPAHQKSFRFGNNQVVVMNSFTPHSSLNKRHNTLSYHQVREMITAKTIGYYWIDRKLNPADIVSKHLACPQMWHLLKSLLFYLDDLGDLGDLIESAEDKKEKRKRMHDVRT